MSEFLGDVGRLILVGILTVIGILAILSGDDL